MYLSNSCNESLEMNWGIWVTFKCHYSECGHADKMNIFLPGQFLNYLCIVLQMLQVLLSHSFSVHFIIFWILKLRIHYASLVIHPLINFAVDRQNFHNSWLLVSESWLLQPVSFTGCSWWNGSSAPCTELNLGEKFQPAICSRSWSLDLILASSLNLMKNMDVQ